MVHSLVWVMQDLYHQPKDYLRWRWAMAEPPLGTMPQGQGHVVSGFWGLGFGFFGKVLTGLQTAFNFTVCVGLLSRLIWGFVGVVRV